MELWQLELDRHRDGIVLYLLALKHCAPPETLAKIRSMLCRATARLDDFRRGLRAPLDPRGD